MFRKTITRFAYSPSLAEELTIYAKQLRREETKRQIGLIFVALALLVQSFAVLHPPESANARSTDTFIEGGFDSLEDYVRYYDQNVHHIKDLYSSLGISRSDIQALRPDLVHPASELLLWKLTSRGDANDTAYNFATNAGATKTAYFQPFTHEESFLQPETATVSSYEAYVGHSSVAGWFALLKGSGNLVTTTFTPRTCTFSKDDTVGAPVPLSLSDIGRCDIKLITTLSAKNLTQGIPAASQDAHPSDRIIYSLTARNNNSYAVSVPLSINLTDILEYAQLMDKGGASFAPQTKTLTWASSTVPPGMSISRSFIIKLLPVVPSMAMGKNIASSYDCMMSGSFGSSVRVSVACPFPKSIERIVNEMPPTSRQANVIFSVVLAILAIYFYARVRLLRTELRVIRHNHFGSL